VRYLKSWDALAVAALAAWHLIFFLPVTLGQKFFAGDDITSLFLPHGIELARALADGRLPLWSTQLQAGFPLFAEGHVAALDPVNLILFRFLSPPFAISYSILFRLIWIAVGSYLYCRALRLSVPAALFAGFIFSFNGFTLAHIQHLTLLAVASWLPWILLFQNEMDRTMREQKKTWVVWFALASLAITIEFLSGFPQVAIINLIPFGLLGLLQSFIHQAEKFSPRVWGKSFALTVGCAILGLGGAAVQWVPAAELLELSVRAQELGREFFTTNSLQPEMLTQFIAPFAALGNPSVFNMEYFGYFGLLPLALIAAAFWRRDARVIFFAILGLGALAFALGEFNPIYSLLYYVPVFNRFRVPARFLLLVLLSASILGAMGLQVILDRVRNYRALAAAVVFIALAGNATDLSRYAQPFLATIDRTVSLTELLQSSRPIQAIDRAAPPFRLFTTVYNESLRPNHLVVDGIASAQIYSPLGIGRNDEYLYFMSPAMLNAMNVRYYTRVSDVKPDENSPWNYAFDLDLFQNQVEIPPTQISSLEIVSYTDQTQDVRDGALAAEIILSASGGSETRLPLRLGIETADWAYEGYSASGTIKHSAPAAAIKFPAFLLSLNREFNGRKYLARFNAPAANATVIGIRAEARLSTGQVTIERVLLTDPSGHTSSLAALAHKNDLALVFKSHAVAMFENRDVLPRAFVVHATQVVADDQIIKRMQDPGFDPGRVAYLAAGDGLDTSGDNSAGADRVEIIEYASERVKLRVATDRAGYVLLADSWYPGWVASMDGRTVAIQRADYIFRAVKLDSGEHTIVFEFRPASFVIGAAISVLSLVALATFTCYIWFRR